MTIKFNVPGKRRKEMAQHIALWIAADIEYLGAPTFAYKIGSLIIDKNGNLEIPDNISEEMVERLLESLYDNGFESDISVEEETPSQTAQEAPQRLSVSMSRTSLDEHAITNLEALVASKGELFKKALAANELPIKVTEETVEFPWFSLNGTCGEGEAYSSFIEKICEMAKNQKRINTTENKVENEKYAFRCFLLRLGFIGDEHKTTRKILLRNLTGSSAFKGGAKNELSE